jgi:hypothetical protein
MVGIYCDHAGSIDLCYAARLCRGAVTVQVFVVYTRHLDKTYIECVFTREDKAQQFANTVRRDIQAKRLKDRRVFVRTSPVSLN